MYEIGDENFYREYSFNLLAVAPYDHTVVKVQITSISMDYVELNKLIVTGQNYRKLNKSYSKMIQS